MTSEISIVGGGIAGLTAAIACAEHGVGVTLYEAHGTLGGRARSTAGPYVANDGPHVFFADGEPFRWLARRGLVRPCARPGLAELAGGRFRSDGRITRVPPGPLRRMITGRRRRLVAPVDRDFGSWAGHHFGEEAARAAAGLVGVLTYESDPGRLSAAFVWQRLLRATAPRYPVVRYAIGGWGAVVDRMAARARDLGVRIETSARVTDLPAPPVIVATTLDAARGLLGDDTLRWEGGHAALLDLGLRGRGRRVGGPRDPYLISDLDEAGFVGRYSLPDPSLAPRGTSLIQAAMPVRSGEPQAGATARLERLVDLGWPGWRDRVTWRRTATARHRTGALDLPGTTWRDRPGVDRGHGVWLAGDSVAAPGLLGEVAIASALTAARAAVGAGSAARPATISLPGSSSRR